MEVQITCDNLKLGYGAGVLVDGLSFTVEKGDYLCIVGENGAGKSTLLRTLLGLQKPLAGKIIFGGGLQQNEIGYLPQQTFVQRDFPASVWEVVLSGCQGRCGLRPFYNREEKQIAKNAMEQLAATGIFPEDSSNGYCLPGLCALRIKCWCWTSRFRDWIPKWRKPCTGWWSASTGKWELQSS